MVKLLEILVTIPGLVLGVFLILKPIAVADLIGRAYWKMSKFTSLGKSEKTRKYFFGNNPYWFRIFGGIITLLWFISFIGMVGS